MQLFVLILPRAARVVILVAVVVVVVAAVAAPSDSVIGIVVEVDGVVCNCCFNVVAYSLGRYVSSYYRCYCFFNGSITTFHCLF